MNLISVPAYVGSHIPDMELGQKVLTKYPEYQDWITDTIKPPAKSVKQGFQQALSDGYTPDELWEGISRNNPKVKQMLSDGHPPEEVRSFLGLSNTQQPPANICPAGANIGEAKIHRQIQAALNDGAPPEEIWDYLSENLQHSKIKHSLCLGFTSEEIQKKLKLNVKSKGPHLDEVLFIYFISIAGFLSIWAVYFTLKYIGKYIIKGFRA